MSESYRVRLADGRESPAATVEVISDWARRGRIPASAVLVPVDGQGQQGAASAHPVIGPLVLAPPTVAGRLPDPKTGNALIPTSNPAALIGYYSSVLSLVPGLGLVLGPLAMGLGVSGLRRARREPWVKGTAHAIVAIVLGSLTSLVNWGAVVLTVGVAMFHR
jgi:hypothetical protein